MRRINSIYKKILLMCLMMISLALTAQTKKILIVSLEDTTMVHGHLGITAFKNYKDSLRISFPFSKYIEDKLSGYLKTSFETHIINAPTEIREKAFGFWGQSKEYKEWIKEVGKGYDNLIIINNIDINKGMRNPLMPTNTSGFFSRGSTRGVFTTISLDAYQTSNNQKLEYDNFGCKFFKILKDFKMPEDKRTFDEQMLETIQNELIELIDIKIKYFLANTYTIPNL